MIERVDNVRTKDLRPGDVIVSGPNGGGSIDSYAFWTVEREKPLLPLPTEPDTLILATRDDGGPTSRQLLLPNGSWSHVGYETIRDPEELAAIITGFEVLAEPRAVTVKAVLDRLPLRGATRGQLVEWVKSMANEFGVSDAD